MDNDQNPRAIFINRVALGRAEILALEPVGTMPVPDGRYWYDPVCGAWGHEGGPTVGFLMPGLPVPAALPPDISAGSTGIFFNGRELHQQERLFLLQLFGMAVPGRYVLNAAGILLTEFGIPIANLRAAAHAGGQPAGVVSAANGFAMSDEQGVVANFSDGTSYVS